MRFLIDAQLPRRMTAWFAAAGCDPIHTFDLPDGNRTTDARLGEAADSEKRGSRQDIYIMHNVYTIDGIHALDGGVADISTLCIMLYTVTPDRAGDR